jgi:hypothetical protein
MCYEKAALETKNSATSSGLVYEKLERPNKVMNNPKKHYHGLVPVSFSI